MESQNKRKIKISNKKKKTVILFRGKRTLFLSNYRKRKSVFLSPKNFSTKSFSLFNGQILRKIVLAVFVLTISLALIFKDFQVSEGATYTWNQTSWSGGISANNPNHNSNQTGWTNYSAKDAGVTAGTELTLTPSAGTANIDFNTEANYLQEDAINGTDWESGKVTLHKTSGSTWVQRTLPANVKWTSVAYGNGTFVAVAYDSTIAATSPDGINWTQRTLPVDKSNALVYGNGIFVAVPYSGNTTAISSDGINWTQGTLPASGLWRSITYGNGLFVAVIDGNNIAAVSSDGINWTQGTLPTSATWFSVTYGNGIFVALVGGTSSSNIAATSPDGINWTQRTLPSSVGWRSSAYGNGVFVAASNTTISATSPDGITWTSRTMPASVSWRSTIYQEGRFVSISYANSIAATSPDGINWTQETLPTTANWYSVTYGNGTFATVAYGSSMSATHSFSYYITTAAASQINTTTYANITGIDLTQTTPTNTSIKYLVSFDNRTTWKYWDGDSWEISSLDDLQTNGMEKSALEAISQAQWESSGGFSPGTTTTLDFAADLKTTDATVTPSLDNIQVSHILAPHSIISSFFDTQSSVNALSKIQWSENLPTDTDIIFQVRTAPDDSGSPGTWTNWTGPDGTETTFFTDPAGEEGMPAIFTDGNDDQWFQYKAYLSTTNPAVTPTLSSVDFNYAVNAPPQFDATYGSNGTNVIQINNSSDPNYGKVKIQYSIKDEDTSTGSFTPDYVTPTFEYTLDGTNYEDVDLNKITFGTAPDGGGYSTYNSKTTNKVLEGSYLTYTAYWDAKTQTGLDGSYSDNFKIRMTINDNEAANNTVVAASAATILDVENPTLGSHPILVNGSISASNVSFSASDESGMQMKVSLNSDLNGASWESYAATKTVTLIDTPETVYVQFRDDYGNVSTIFSAITPEIPPSMMIQDTSNLNSPEPHEYRLFVAWKKIAEAVPAFGSYEVYRSESASGPWGSPIATILSRNTNYYGDSVAANTAYYYKVRTIDADGNISAFSDVVNGSANGIQDGGEGGGGTDLNPPSVSSVLSTSVTTNSALITWDTNEFATSTVGFSDSAGNFETEMGVDGYEESHSVLLTGLTPETDYYFQLKSADAIGNLTTANNGGLGYEFTTLPGPAISNISVKETSNFQSTISWITSTDSNTVLTYTSTLDSNGAMVDAHTLGDDSDLVGGTAPFVHEQVISELTEGTKYYFLVKSVDGENNAATDNNGGEFYEFTTLSDNQDPILSSISTALISNDGVAIHWVTDEQASSQVQYRKEGGSSYTSTAASMILGKNHYVIISSLDSNTEYEYRVISEDINGNEAISGIETFETLNDPEFQHEPLSEITGIANPPSIITDTKAVITFNTDQAAKCAIEYGTTTGNYSEVPFVESSYNENHSIHITGLIFSTQYFYKITCLDNLDTSVESTEFNFVTAAAAEAEDGVAPEISSINVGTITGESATVSWKTDKVGSSFVSYGITSGTYENGAVDSLVNFDPANYITDHTVIINNLTPATKYYFKVGSTDTSGNVGESTEESFTTKAPSSLSSIKVASTSLSEVIITWDTSTKMNSTVEYGLTTDYGETKSSSSTTTDHEVKISGLKEATVYHFRVKGTDADNNIYSSGDYTFEPKSPPKVSSVSVDSITEHGANITIATDIPTDVLVTYFEKTDPKNSGSQGKPDFLTKRTVELTNLKSGVTYVYTVKVVDEQGNQTTGEAKEFTTDKDENPPKISQIKTDGAIAQNDKVQMIISWATDEPSTTAFIYREGINGEEKEILVSEAYTQNHTVVSTIFKSGTVYYFKTKSIDQAGNETISSDFALLTPKKKENIVQIIVNNFQDIFGWAKVLQ